MKNSTLGLIFQLPAMILLVIIAIGGFVVKIKNLLPTTWATPLTLLVIVVLFFVGLYLSRKSDYPY
jgi:hypothetical protein